MKTVKKQVWDNVDRQVLVQVRYQVWIQVWRNVENKARSKP
jgi:hypothetical protein